jgi:hypothetical protein
MIGSKGLLIPDFNRFRIPKEDIIHVPGTEDLVTSIVKLEGHEGLYLVGSKSISIFNIDEKRFLRI